MWAMPTMKKMILQTVIDFLWFCPGSGKSDPLSPGQAYSIDQWQPDMGMGDKNMRNSNPFIPARPDTNDINLERLMRKRIVVY